jgi:hypothetical protein
MSLSSAVIKLGVAAIVLPAVGFAVGLGLQAAIPGCKCDEGAGCSPCGGFGGLIAFLVFGGFVGALFSLLFVLPVSLLVAAVAAIFGSKQSAPVVALSVGAADDPVDANVIAAALSDYRAGRPITARCKWCHSVLLVKPAKPKPGRDPAALRVNCACGKSNGSFEMA